MRDFTIFLTLDVDYTNYVGGWESIDEFEIIESVILPGLDKLNIPATWFIRIDNRILAEYGSADYLFNKYSGLIQLMKKRGHSIGWHPHIYEMNLDERWIQCTDESKVLTELKKILPLAKKFKLDIVRMGWGFQTNKIMKFLADSGFYLDSSAMPRKNYSWDMSVKDWSGSSQYPYYPSLHSYKSSALHKIDELSILECPMSMAVMPIATDTDSNVVRYCNPAFHCKDFQKAFEFKIRNENLLVTITHPYELDSSYSGRHSLLSFNEEVFFSNITWLEECCLRNNKKPRFEVLNNIKKILAVNR